MHLGALRAHAAAALTITTLLLVAGCTPPATPVDNATAASPSSEGAPVDEDASADDTSNDAASAAAVTVGLPFRPDVQFTPFYVARERGFYREAGLDVSFEYGSETDFLRRVANGEMTATVASGEQVVLARDNGLPVTYIMTWYQRFPVVVFATDARLERPEDLAGLAVGLPALEGASYLGWQALLAESDLAPDAVDVAVIGFTQLEAVAGGQVDAAVGYAANEPLRLAAAGRDVAVLEIADTYDLAANGLVVRTSTLQAQPALAEALVAATRRGLGETIDDPDSAFETALAVVPEAGDPEVRQVQREVLSRSIDFWRGEPLGAIDTADWQRTIDFLVGQGLIEEPLEAEDMYDARYVGHVDR